MRPAQPIHAHVAQARHRGQTAGNLLAAPGRSMVKRTGLRSAFCRNHVPPRDRFGFRAGGSARAAGLLAREVARRKSLSVTFGAMKLRAAIFDIYDTLLEVGPGPADAGERWEKLWQIRFGVAAPVTLEQFAADCDQATAREHAAAQALGVEHPEVYWPDIAVTSRPELATLT